MYEHTDRDGSKLVKAKKTDTIREFVQNLKNEISTDFCPEGFFSAEPENIRLRGYDPRLKIKSVIY